MNNGQTHHVWIPSELHSEIPTQAIRLRYSQAGLGKWWIYYTNNSEITNVKNEA